MHKEIDNLQKELKRRIAYENLLSQISIMAVKPLSLDSFLDQCVDLLGETVGVSRTYLFELDVMADTMSNTFEWCAAGIAPQIDNLQGIPLSGFSWWIETLRHEQLICFEDVRLIPDPATQEILNPQGILSICVVPLLIDDRLSGFIGFDDCVENHAWPPEDVMLLQSIARIISGVISRHDYLQKQNKLQLQLNQAQKMESVGRLAGGVAHDFNNMLNVILGHTEMLLEDMNERNPLLENVLEIQKAARHSADLTGQLLAFARKQAIAPKVVDLNQVIRSMLSMLKRLIGENIALKFYEGKNLYKTKIDPSQLDQILANLVVNARDAIQGNGIISIETLNLSPDASYLSKRSEFVPGDYVLLAISDNGSGMDEKTISCIFEPFFTTKVIGKGTGLGLATVYGIVKQNNGFVYVYSEKDIGSCFKIFLPRHFEAEAVMVEKNSGESAPTGNECLLLVEDEPIILKMTKKILERLGYRVLSTQSPLEAIRLADDHKNEIRLLISDVVMPQANGKELAKALVENIPNLKTLFISGYTADVIATHGILDEGINFLQKPFTRNELAQKVRDILDK